MAKPFSAVPGPKGLKALMDFSPLGKYSFERMHFAKRDNYAKFGHIYKERLGPGINVVQIFDPEDVATIFRADDKSPLRPPIPVVITANKRDKLPIGLGAMNGGEWYKLRSAVQKLMMRPRSAAGYLPAQNAVANNFIPLIRNNLDQEGVCQDFADLITKYTMESISVVCFGQEIGYMQAHIAPSSEAEIMMSESTRLFEAVQRTTFAFPWHILFRTKLYKQFVDSKRLIDAIAGSHIDKAMGSLSGDSNPSDSGCPHFLSTLLNADQLSHSQITGITTDLFTAGIDSTANALSFVIYNLSRNIDKQERLRREINNQISDNEDVTASELDHMHYLKAVLKESFRLNFPVEGGTTRILSKDVIVSGFEVKKGTIIAFNNQTMCLQEKYFEDAEKFLPERWLKDGSASLKPPPKFVMLPFGYGPRMCIGRRFAEQEIYLALIKILQAYKVEYVGGEEIGMLNRVFTMPDAPIRIKFTSA